MKEPEYNENGCVAGGFVFDQMDRYAHNIIKERAGAKHVFTSNALIRFYKQICDWNSVELDKTEIHSGQNPDEFNITIGIFEKGTTTLYASATFVFVTKDHAYCTKEPEVVVEPFVNWDKIKERTKKQ